jgi:hypothetical protein
METTDRFRERPVMWLLCGGCPARSRKSGLFGDGDALTVLADCHLVCDFGGKGPHRTLLSSDRSGCAIDHPESSCHSPAAALLQRAGVPVRLLVGTDMDRSVTDATVRLHGDRSIADATVRLDGDRCVVAVVGRDDERSGASANSEDEHGDCGRDPGTEVRCHVMLLI